MMVDVLGLQAWVRELSVRADHGDAEAEHALSKLQEGLEAVKELCLDGPELTVDQYLVLREGLSILLDAVDGRSNLSREELRQIARQTAQDCKRLRCKVFDEAALSKFLEEDD